MDQTLSAISSELTVRLERRIARPAQHVWNVMSSPDTMRDWLGPRTYEPQAGGRILFDVLHGTRPDGRPQRWLMFGNITTWEPGRELAFTWQEFDTATLTCWPAPTTVRLRLTPQDEGCLVTLAHSGFEALPDGLEQFKGYQEGWASLNDLETLAQMCEAL